MKGKNSALTYCMNMVRYYLGLTRLNDNEGYLTTLFTPLKSREAIWAIRALNIETAQIQDVVTKPEIGRMRMQWWKKEIDDTFNGKGGEHPVSALLANSLDLGLTQTWITRMLRARDNHLNTSQFASMNDLEEYAEHTASSLLYLHLEALGVNDINAEHAVSHLGKAIGITLILRSVAFNLEKNRMVLPSEIMAKVDFFE